jgi:ABC-2 type transport system ATP-binding protein
MLFDGTPEELQQRSKYHQAITLRFTNSPDPQTIVNAIAGVESFEVSSDGRDITLFAKSDVSYQQVREEAEKHQWNIKGVFLEQGRMDDVFRSITEEAA